MPYSLDVYDSEFFSTNQWEGLRHAEWFCPLLQDIFQPKSIVDVGCGTGHFVEWFQEHGMWDAWGIEGSDAAVAAQLVPIWKHDLRTPLWPDPRRVDLAISIEVAEHIEEEFAGVFVDTLCALSDTVVLTAAPPGQGGEHHVNERPWEYWRDLFRARGFRFDAARHALLVEGIKAAQVAGHHVAAWFPANIMCFERIYPYA